MTSAGAVFILWGILWRLWDKGSDTPFYLAMLGIVCLLGGSALGW